jgi:hypothetical protein
MDKKDTVVTRWLNEIDLAKKREKNYRKEGKKVLKIYDGDDARVPFNILYSNTETLLPACYALPPRPVVERRFKDADPIGKAAAEAGKRVLEFLLDTNIDGYETFDEGMRCATLDALLPGRGITAVKYDSEIGELEDGDTSADPADEDEDEQEVKDSSEPVEPAEYKKSELICLDSKCWDRVYIGYSKKWATVPWIAYEMQIDKEEAQRLKIKPEIISQLIFKEQPREKDDDESDESADKNHGDRRVITMYQIWDKDGDRKIRYITPQYKDDYLKVDDDPLELTGFFNCPKPMQFLEKSNNLLPTALYSLYESQAKDLNELSRRISLLAKAIKAKAVYDTSLGDDIKNLVEAEDNDLVPAEAASSLAAEKGFMNAIWFWPIDQMAKVLQILVATRNDCKEVIYEITGISDILRGASNAAETATAQKIKSQWGSLRLKRLQKEVQRYARDLLRMMLEIAATKFSEETWAKMTGLPYLTEMQFAQLTAQSQAIQGMLQRAQLMMPPQQMGVPPQPMPPEVAQMQQQAMQLQKQLQVPQWSQVLAMLKDDMQRAYRIDIETNSTVEAEATEDKEQMAEAMAALGQALNGITPLVTSGSLPWEAAQAMLLTIMRRFRFGVDIEDMIKQMKPPQPPQDGKAQALQQQAKLDEQKMQMEQQNRQADMQAKQADMAQNAELERGKVQGQLAIEQARVQGEIQREAMRIEADKRAGIAKMAADKWIAEMQAKYQMETALQVAAMEAANKLQIAKEAPKPVASK